jgi:3-mercaptopyruvate sulfurtransferase SseA
MGDCADSDTIRRDILSKEEMGKLLAASGADENSIIVLYGDSNNWFAAWAFWQLKVYGHKDVRLMDGGRKKWEQEGRPMTTAKPFRRQKAVSGTTSRPLAAGVSPGDSGTSCEEAD